MIAYILLGVAVVLAVLVIVVATRPTDFHVERTALFSSSPAAVFEQVNNLHNWNAWSPWARLDPNAKNTFEGPPAGIGAMFRWAGNKNVGEGSMTILESRPAELVRFKLEFLKSFKATNTATFTFQPESGGTRVTWSLDGRNNFVAKAVGLFIDCDKMVGGQFEQGFANLKSVLQVDGQKS